ncbi:MAG: hypothetical protein ACKKMR_00370 [Candidatus Nealsonbacteria bacterium]
MIIGHKKQQQFLKKIISSREIPHALLFTGPEGLGKKTIALQFLSSLFGEKLFQHPDFSLITPITKQIQINQIRDLRWRLSLKPIKAPLLGAVVDKAHLMTREAQNCFLKTLEEPKSRSLLILISEYPNYLLSTIVSRCEKIKFYQVENREITSYLEKKKVSKEKIEEIVEISLGRPGRAVNILQNPEKLEERKKKIRELIKISGSPLSLRFKYVKELAQQQDLKETLGIWLFYFRKGLISCRNRTELIKIKNILKAVQETMFLLSTTNVNPRLALEILTMKL